MEEQLSEVTRRSEVSSKAGTCGLLWCSTLEVPESESLTEHFSFILSSLHSSQSLYLRKKGTWKLSKKSLSKTLTSLRRGQLFKSPFVFCYLKQGTLVTEWAEKHVSMTEQYLYEMKILQERKIRRSLGDPKSLECLQYPADTSAWGWCLRSSSWTDSTSGNSNLMINYYLCINMLGVLVKTNTYTLKYTHTRAHPCYTWICFFLYIYLLVGTTKKLP